jgi:hypothetical protein
MTSQHEYVEAAEVPASPDYFRGDPGGSLDRELRSLAKAGLKVLGFDRRDEVDSKGMFLREVWRFKVMADR